MTLPCVGRLHLAFMTTLHPSRAVSGKHLAYRRRSGLRRHWASPIRRAMQAVAAGAVAILIVGTGLPMPPGPALVLGVALIVWLVGTFALERPDGG